MLFLLLFLRFGANAQAIFPPGTEFTCRDKDGKSVFSMRFVAAYGSRAFEGKISGNAPFDLAKAFPVVEVEMNEQLMVVELPTQAMAADENPYDLEITIDRTNGLGRFSAIDKRQQGSACADADCPDSMEVDCNEPHH